MTLMLIYNIFSLITYIFIYILQYKGSIVLLLGRGGGGRTMPTGCHKVHESVSQLQSRPEAGVLVRRRR